MLSSNVNIYSLAPGLFKTYLCKYLYYTDIILYRCAYNIAVVYDNLSLHAWQWELVFIKFEMRKSNKRCYFVRMLLRIFVCMFRL